MSISKTWPNGIVDTTPTSFSIPEADDLNWSSLTNFLTSLADSAQSTTFQRFAISKEVTTPISISYLDCVIVSDMTTPSSVAITLPQGTAKQMFIIVDGKGDAASNNLTITPFAGDTIQGGGSFVMNSNNQGIMIVFSDVDSDWKVVLNCKP